MAQMQIPSFIQVAQQRQGVSKQREC